MCKVLRGVLNVSDVREGEYCTDFGKADLLEVFAVRGRYEKRAKRPIAERLLVPRLDLEYKCGTEVLDEARQAKHGHKKKLNTKARMQVTAVQSQKSSKNLGSKGGPEGKSRVSTSSSAICTRVL